MKRDGFGPLAITLAMQALISMAALTVPVLAPAATRELQGSPTLVGLYVALIYLGAMICSLLSGNWVLRFGAIRVSQACLLLAAVGLAIAAVGNLWCMALSALLIGAGYGPVTPASSHILARTTPAHRISFMFSLKQTGVPLGGALAGLLVPGLVGLVGWRGALLATALACLLMAVIAQATRQALDDDRNPQHTVRHDRFKPLALIFADTRLRSLALSSMFFGAIQLCLTTFLVTYLTHDYGLALVTAGLVLALTQGAGMVGRLLWGWVADRWLAPQRLLPVLALIMAVASLLTATFTHDWPLAAIIGVSMLFGATAIGWNGVLLAEIARLAPAGSAGMVTGGTLFFTYFGVVAGPPAFAWLAAASDSLGIGFAAFGVLLFVVGVALIRIAARAPRAVTEIS